MKQFKRSVKKSRGHYLVKKDAFINLFEIDEGKIDYRIPRNKKWLGVFDLMELVSRLSLVEPDRLDRNLRIADFIEMMIGDVEKHFFVSNFRMMIMKNFMDSRPTEFDIHEKFENGYRNVLGNNYEIVKVKNNPKHIPDFWLENGDDFIPVEIKLHDFSSAHLKQLQRYMDFYKCDRGVAVGKELKCSLPNNIKFINYEQL